MSRTVTPEQATELDDDLKIDLGGGTDPEPDHLNVDLRAVSECDVQAAATALPFADDSFERLHANSLVPHVDDLPALLEECARIVKPGGEIVLKATHAHSTGIVADPDHSLWSWTSETPSWFDPDSEYAYYCDAPLELVSVDVVGWCRPERWWLLHYSLFMNIATAFLSNTVADELMKLPFSAGRVIATWQVTAPSGDADAT